MLEIRQVSPGEDRDGFIAARPNRDTVVADSTSCMRSCGWWAYRRRSCSTRLAWPRARSPTGSTRTSCNAVGTAEEFGTSDECPHRRGGGARVFLEGRRPLPGILCSRAEDGRRGGRGAGGAGAVPEFSWMAAKRCPRTSVFERMAHDGDVSAGRFVAKLVAIRQAGATIRTVEPQILLGWHTPGRSFPWPRRRECADRPPRPASAKTLMIFSMPQMRTETLGMSSHAARLGVSMA